MRLNTLRVGKKCRYHRCATEFRPGMKASREDLRVGHFVDTESGGFSERVGCLWFSRRATLVRCEFQADHPELMNLEKISRPYDLLPSTGPDLITATRVQGDIRKK